MPRVRAATRLPPGVQVGPTGPRLLAAMVEVGPVWLLIALALLFGFVLDGRLAVAVLCVLLALGWSIVVWGQRASRAAGPGMRLDSIQIVGFSDGRPIGWGRVLIRGLVFAGLSVTAVGLLAMIVAMGRHPRRQGWHDLAADAVVIKERPLIPPRSKAAAQQGIPAAGRTPVAAPAPLVAAAIPEVEPVPDPILRTEATPIPGPQPERAMAHDRRVDGQWSLRLDDGRDLGIDGLVLLGRNPQPRVGEEDATLVKVVDHGRTVSKSHLAVGVDVRGLYVMDRGSTNGTTVTTPDGTQRPCPPGDLVDVASGSIVSFGDHWLEVRRTGH